MLLLVCMDMYITRVWERDNYMCYQNIREIALKLVFNYPVVNDLSNI